MEKLSTENLFLLEFLVDDVKMDGKCECDTPPGEHCVSFQFLDNENLEVCEADFSPGRKYGKDDCMKSGKSCLFSLMPEQVEEAQQVFDVTVSVFKKMQPGWLPDKICIGTAIISIANLFAELIKSVEMQIEQAPAAKTMKDTFTLLDSADSRVGKICIYIRMSCFGKLIVTQFQMNLEDQSVLFKDKGGQSLYRYKKSSKQESLNEPPQPPNTPQYMQPPPEQFNQPQMYPQQNGGFPPNPYFSGDQNMFPQFPQQDMGMYQSMAPQSDMFPPMGSNMLPCSECNIMMQPQQPPCGDQGASQFLTPCEECGTLLPPQFKAEVAASATIPVPDPPGNYQEIGASMGGNALTIRVHKDKNRIEQIDNGGSEGSCCCTPGNIGAPKPKKENSYPVACAQPQSFDIQPGLQQGDKNLPFSFKMSGGGSPSNNVVVNPPVCTKPDGTKFTEISDPNKEMFVLRIGKKSEGAQKKANLELELCTPRGPDLKPIPKKETRDSQYNPADCPADGKKGKKGKGKGKGKKGKGGKKGKKGKKK